MVMNKKGQWVIAGVLIAVMVFIIAVQFIQPLKNEINTARSPPNLDCTNASISTGQKATCVITDFYLFYFLGMTMAAGLSYLAYKKIKDIYQ